MWPLLALVLAGQLIQMSQAHPYGPVGFSLVFLVALGLERWLARPPAGPVVKDAAWVDSPAANSP